MANDANEDKVAVVTFRTAGKQDAARLTNLMGGWPEAQRYHFNIKENGIDLGPISEAGHTRIIIFIGGISCRHTMLLGVKLKEILDASSPPKIQIFDGWCIYDLPKSDWVSVFKHPDFEAVLSSQG